MSHHQPRSPEVSVILAVRRAEDTVGHRVQAVARHLRSLGIEFDVLAVNDGCFDNSLAILSLLAENVPELRILAGDASGRAFLRGAAEARGAVVVLMDAAAPAPLAPLGWALRRLAAGREAVILRGRYIVARRLPALPVLVRERGRFPSFERGFERQAGALGIDVVGTRPRRPARAGLLGSMLRLLDAS